MGLFGEVWVWFWPKGVLQHGAGVQGVPRGQWLHTQQPETQHHPHSHHCRHLKYCQIFNIFSIFQLFLRFRHLKHFRIFQLFHGFQHL